MKKSLGIVTAILVLVGGVVAYRLCDGWIVIEIAARLHSEWGSTSCGHVTNSFYHGERPSPDVAVTCAQNALEHHHAFSVIFTGYGIDEEVSNALVANSKGKAVEVFYATGMVTNRNKLLRHRCDFPTRLVVEKNSPYGFPRLHCAEWPPKDLD
jgi:hypothetical protein